MTGPPRYEGYGPAICDSHWITVGPEQRGDGRAWPTHLYRRFDGDQDYFFVAEFQSPHEAREVRDSLNAGHRA